MSAGHGTPIAGHALLQNTHRPSHTMFVALHLCGGHGDYSRIREEGEYEWEL